MSIEAKIFKTHITVTSIQSSVIEKTHKKYKKNMDYILNNQLVLTNNFSSTKPLDEIRVKAN